MSLTPPIRYNPNIIFIFPIALRPFIRRCHINYLCPKSTLEGHRFTLFGAIGDSVGNASMVTQTIVTNLEDPRINETTKNSSTVLFVNETCKIKRVTKKSWAWWKHYDYFVSCVDLMIIFSAGFFLSDLWTPLLSKKSLKPIPRYVWNPRASRARKGHEISGIEWTVRNVIIYT